MLNPRWPPKWMLDYKIDPSLINIPSRDMIPDSTYMFWNTRNTNLQLFVMLRSHKHAKSKMAAKFEAKLQNSQYLEKYWT